jgi:hypothetical protein
MTLWRPVSEAFRSFPTKLSLVAHKSSESIRRRHGEMATTCMAKRNMAEENMAEEDIVKDDILKEYMVEEDKEDMCSPTCLHAGEHGELKDRHPSYGIPPAPVEEQVVEEEVVKEEVVEEEISEEELVEEGTSTYNYEQLDLTKQQIRLITLHVAIESSDPIRCDIHTFDTSKKPHYVALSYTWGPEHPKQTILINGRQFSIRQNLYDFLLRYRKDYSENIHYLWIDQICISQAHEGERNHQVRLMAQIYSQSFSTIIWLGEDSLEAAQRYKKTRDLDDVYTLFRNSYFNRLWVIQEIFLSSHKRVLCGSIWLNLNDLISTFQGSDYSRIHPVEFMNFIFVEDDWNTSLIERGQGSLRYCIDRFSACNCEDPRDKVYGLLSLVHEDDRLEVDYSKSTEDVFLQVVMFIGSQGLSKYDADFMLLLSDSMKLHEHRYVHKEFLKELSERFENGEVGKIEVGFERRRHQSIVGCDSRFHDLQGCCSDRWWFLRYGVKQYRDRSSYSKYYSRRVTI